MIMSLVLFENEFLHIVSISFTALVLNELIMVALEITTWQVSNFLFFLFFFLIFQTKPLPLFKKKKRHLYMVISEVVTLFFYIISIAFLPAYFGTFSFFFFFFSSFLFLSLIPPPPLSLSDLSFVVTLAFAWKVTVIVALSALPLYIIKVIHMRVAPAASSKLL